MTAYYFTALAEELAALNRQLESLLPPAHLPLGEAYAGTTLRKMLSRYLPSTLRTGKGYISQENGRALPAEVLVYEAAAPVLFEEGSLAVVMPESVVAVMEVAPVIESQVHLRQLLTRLADAAQAVRSEGRTVLAVLLSYRTQLPDEAAADIVREVAGDQPARMISCMALGNTCFVAVENGQVTLDTTEGAVSRLLRHIIRFTPRPQPVPGADDTLTPDTLPAREPAIRPVAPVSVLPDTAAPAAEPATESQAYLKTQEEPVAVMTLESAPAAVYTPEVVSEADDSEVEALINRPRKRRNHDKGRPNQPNAEGYYPLHQAVMAGDAEAITELLHADADPDCKNREGDTPIHLAVRLDKPDLIEMLLLGDADVNARNYVYASPLHLAAELDKVAMIQLLIRNGAEIEARNNRGNTPLHKAAILGHVAAAEELIRNQADILACMEKDMQPLHLAAWYGHVDMVQLLINSGADLNAVNADGNTALHFAAFNGQVKAIKTLINNSAAMHIKNHSGETYLQGLNEGYQGEMVRVLE
ncbi:MAG: ankyrin repeat domain-containing protein [Bacteroidia bacterium]|nr:ankyrin repeat domain-containing protein [Bacteroidia bacterium]